jgi:hypothetical protein
LVTNFRICDAPPNIKRRISACMAHMSVRRVALDKYKQKNGKYPNELDRISELPYFGGEYLSDKNSLLSKTNNNQIEYESDGKVYLIRFKIKNSDIVLEATQTYFKKINMKTKEVTEYK